MNAPDRLSTVMSADRNPWPPEGHEEHYRALIAQIGSEIGASLSSALERVNALTATGKIDRPGLRALRDEIELARRVGMVGQQLARFASGRIRQSPETLSLTQMARDVLLQRGREINARGLEVRQALRPVDVVVDATLLHSLLQALVDWTLEHARGDVELRIDMRPWPPHARLSCHFSHLPPAQVDAVIVARNDHDASAALDTLSWRLVQQIAWALKLGLERHEGPEGVTALSIEFPQTVTEQLEGVTAIEIDQGFGVSDNSKPLAGTQVLVLAQRRDLRSDIREATRHMGLVVDFVSSIDEAETFCRDALPQALIYESSMGGSTRFDKLRQGIQADLPNFAFIEIATEGDGFTLSKEGGSAHAVIGREAVLASLPSALIFELSRAM